MVRPAPVVLRAWRVALRQSACVGHSTLNFGVETQRLEEQMPCILGTARMGSSIIGYKFAQGIAALIRVRYDANFVRRDRHCLH